LVEPLIVERLREARIAVIGDLMLDHHVYGRVSRISDEAPVPVLHVRDERRSLGGAANVAANAASLGAQVRLVGLIGADAAGGQLVDLLETQFPSVEPRLFIDPERPTVTKTRYLGGQQQIVRVDREITTPAPWKLEQELIEEAREALASANVIVLSDYGKGVLTDAVLAAVFEAAARFGAPVVVDPKRMRFADYRGAAYITPNRKELTLATGLACDTEEEAAAAAARAIADCGAAILLTRSEKGMSLFAEGLAPIHLAAEAREVFDVSGAGDTVVAALAAGLSAGLPAAQAMRAANAAAGVVVAKLGAAQVTRDELSDALRSRGSKRSAAAAAAGPLVPLPDLVALRERWANEGLTVGFTNGCFDLVHPGHISLLSQAASACDRLIVALNDDASVRRLKGETRPLQPLEARAAVMAAIRGVDAVAAFAEDTPAALIEALAPDLLVKGADYREEEVVGAEAVKARGGRVLLAQLTPGQSTTAIAGRLAPKD
jgi:D-beta-D-heptose 7-phosphate kinase/D-beta-D-heptose 1-phosphate adenosyltransferase